MGCFPVHELLNKACKIFNIYSVELFWIKKPIYVFRFLYAFPVLPLWHPHVPRVHRTCLSLEPPNLVLPPDQTSALSFHSLEFTDLHSFLRVLPADWLMYQLSQCCYLSEVTFVLVLRSIKWFMWDISEAVETFVLGKGVSCPAILKILAS